MFLLTLLSLGKDPDSMNLDPQSIFFFSWNFSIHLYSSALCLLIMNQCRSFSFSLCWFYPCLVAIDQVLNILLPCVWHRFRCHFGKSSIHFIICHMILPWYSKYHSQHAVIRTMNYFFCDNEQSPFYIFSFRLDFHILSYLNGIVSPKI